MTVIVSGDQTVVTPGVQNPGYIGRALAHRMYLWLIANGWTSVGGSDGTTGGMGSGFGIVFGELSPPGHRWLLGEAVYVNGWEVLESPHASPSDRVQILIANGDQPYAARIGFCQNADLTGGDAVNLPTSPSNSLAQKSYTTNGSAVLARRYTYVYDDVTHEFAVMSNVPTLSRGRDSVVFAQIVPNDFFTNNYAFYMHVVIAGDSDVVSYVFNIEGLTGENTEAGWLSAWPGATSGQAKAMRPQGRNGSGTLIDLPGGCAQTVTTSAYTSMPLSVCSRSQAIYRLGEISDFIRWNGQTRVYQDTYGPDGSTLARICCPLVSVKWDGSTVPSLGS